MERDGDADVDKRNLCFTTSWSRGRATAAAAQAEVVAEAEWADEVAAVEDAVKVAVAVDVRVVAGAVLLESCTTCRVEFRTRNEVNEILRYVTLHITFYVLNVNEARQSSMRK